MNNEMKVFDFDLAVREQYEAVVAGAAMQMSGWEDEEPAAIRRILRSPERAQRFLESLERVNRFVKEELLRYPPSNATHTLLNRMAKYYSCCAVFCAIWLSRNALKVYLHDQKRLPGAPETTAEDILSASEDPQGILSSLYSLYHVLYNCPRDELVADYRGVVEEFLEDYLDICLAVADDPEVRKLRDYLRDFFAYEYQPVFTRPTSWAEYNELPEMKFPELAARWKEAVLSYAISFAKRQQAQAPIPAIVVGVDEKVKSSFLASISDVFGNFMASIVRKLKPGKNPPISISRASEITGLSVDQLRYLESKPASERYGYPGRTGENIAFIGTALRHWAKNYKSAQQADKAVRQGLKNPIHLPNL